jgi:hypothetical protein
LDSKHGFIAYFQGLAPYPPMFDNRGGTAVEQGSNSGELTAVIAETAGANALDIYQSCQRAERTPVDVSFVPTLSRLASMLNRRRSGCWQHASKQ